MELTKRILAHFFPTHSDMKLALLLINTVRSVKSVFIKILSKIVITRTRCQKKNIMKPKFFLEEEHFNDPNRQTNPAKTAGRYRACL
jgi:hypothetical protein